jgi:SAM-dependent methyltransferase
MKRSETKMSFFAPYKYKFIESSRSGGRRVLEAGIGNDSPLMFFRYYKGYEYDGIDITKECGLSPESLKLIGKFFLINLENEELNSIPDIYYDYVVIAHVIEHINNGEDVIARLSDKLKPGGVIYAEYPSERSARFPSMKGTLNFYDDPTHKRFYEIEKLKKILTESGCEIIGSGIKRDYLRVLGIPYMIIKSLFVRGYVRGSVFWDLLGFAEYIAARRVA